MKLTKRIKKHIGRAAVLLSLITAVQSAVVPYNFVYADEAAEEAAEEAAADDEYIINPPKFGVYTMNKYKLMKSYADMPKTNTPMVLAWDNYILPVNTQTLRCGDKGFVRYYTHVGREKYENYPGSSDPKVTEEYKNLAGAGLPVTDLQSYNETVAGLFTRMTAYDASSFPGAVIGADTFVTTGKTNQRLSPGYINDGNIIAVYPGGVTYCYVAEDDKVQKFQLVRYEDRPYRLQLVLSTAFNNGGILPWYNNDFEGDEYLRDSEKLQFSWNGDQVYIYDPYGSDGKTNNYVCMMVHYGNKVYGRPYGYISNVSKDCGFYIYTIEDMKFTSIPDYTVTQTFEIKAGEYGTADGGTDKTEGIIIPPGTTLKIEKGAVMTVAGNLINDGTIETEGTIIIQKGGSISSFRAGSEPSKNGCGTIKCNGGDIIILEGGALYAGMADDNGASVPFNLDSGSTLVNKGLLVYGTMNLGQSARVELRKGSKTYGSWINAKAVKETVTHEISVTNDDAVQLYKDAYRNYMSIPSYESLLEQYKVSLLRSKFSDISAHYSELGYRSKGMSDADLQKLEPTVTSKYGRHYKFQLDWFYEEPIVQADTFDTYNSAFLSGKTSGITQLSTVGSEAYGAYKETLGICVNSNAEGKYAPRIKMADGAYFNDPLKDETVAVEELTL